MVGQRDRFAECQAVVGRRPQAQLADGIVVVDVQGAVAVDEDRIAELGASYRTLKVGTLPRRAVPPGQAEHALVIVAYAEEVVGDDRLTEGVDRDAVVGDSRLVPVGGLEGLVNVRGRGSELYGFRATVRLGDVAVARVVDRIGSKMSDRSRPALRPVPH